MLGLTVFHRNYSAELEGHSYGQLVTGSFITTTCLVTLLPRAEFFCEHQITQVTQSPYSPELVPCNFWLFPQTKITFEREKISDRQQDSGKYDGAADGNWQNCAIGNNCKVSTLKGTEVSLSYVQCFLYLLQ